MTSMQRLEDWQYADNVRDLLAERLLQGQLTVVLGAGASKALGLPLLNELLERLESHCALPVDSALSAWERADRVRESYGDDFVLKSSAHRLLYEGVDIAGAANMPLLLALGAVLTAASRHGPTTVVTLNYDDLLEQYLEIYGNVVEVDHDGRGPIAGGDVCVWHPHGFLPQNDPKRASRTIVLDTASYARIAADAHWQQLLVTQMQRSFCLFIGLSGDDPHLKRHLGLCALENTFLSTLPCWGVWLTATKDFSAIRNVLADARVHVLPFSTYEKYPEFLLAICQSAAERRGRRSAASSAPLHRRSR